MKVWPTETRRHKMDRKKRNMVGVNGKSFIFTVSELKKISYRTREHGVSTAP